ncbi:Putative liporotein LppU [Mycobacteroides abscessus]|nr:Putative liporotein LppU [Mycobacteroides abscessus]
MRALFVVMGLCGFAIAGCAQAEETPSTKQSATRQESTDFADIPGQFPSPGSLTANGQAEAPVGGCVNLGGELVNASLTVVDCGSDRNTYRIVQRVNIPQECGDTDRSYYHNSEATGQYTACLDLAWAKDSCISLGQPVARSSAQTPTHPNESSHSRSSWTPPHWKAARRAVTNTRSASSRSARRPRSSLPYVADGVTQRRWTVDELAVTLARSLRPARGWAASECRWRRPESGFRDPILSSCLSMNVAMLPSQSRYSGPTLPAAAHRRLRQARSHWAGQISRIEAAGWAVTAVPTAD